MLNFLIDTMTKFKNNKYEETRHKRLQNKFTFKKPVDIYWCVVRVYLAEYFAIPWL